MPPRYRRISPNTASKNFSPTTVTHSRSLPLAVHSLGSIGRDIRSGLCYLAANSPYRNVGVSNTAIGAELRTKTTYPPIVYPYAARITNQDLTLTMQAQRDTDQPDIGWHPEPLDYVFSASYVSNANIVVQPGAVLGFYGGAANLYGLGFGPGSSLVAEGSPTNLVRFVRYSTVQEVANTNWSGIPNTLLMLPWEEVQPPPELRFRFVEFSMLAAEAYHVYGWEYHANMLPVRVADSQMRGGKFYTEGPPCTFTNCLFERVNGFLFAYSGVPFTNIFQNNLFHGGDWVAFVYDSTNEMVFHDNVFDQTVLLSSDVANSYNGYFTNNCVGCIRLLPEGSTDAVLTSLTYQAGPLSRYYLPTNSPLIDAGSVTNAGFKGLYWYTSVTNQALDAATRLNIGLHFVGVTNGVPIDTDGDGIPSYGEDVNGNGSVDSGETDWNDANDFGLRVLITRPKQGSVIP